MSGGKCPGELSGYPYGRYRKRAHVIRFNERLTDDCRSSDHSGHEFLRATSDALLRVESNTDSISEVPSIGSITSPINVMSKESIPSSFTTPVCDLSTNVRLNNNINR